MLNQQILNTNPLNHGEYNLMSTINIVTANAKSHRENLNTVMAVAASTDGSLPLSYSISGGADAAKFAINASTGILSFVNTPDFETPTDADANNVYEVEVSATDGDAGTTAATQTISVTVTDVDDALEKVEALASTIAGDIADLTLATTALQNDKADKTALALVEQAVDSLETNMTALQAKVDVPGTVSEAIEDATTALKTELLNGVSADWDTFFEVVERIASNEDVMTTIQTMSAGAIRFDIAQVLTSSQQQRARMNIGAASEAELQDFKASIGNNETFDPVDAYAAAKNAAIAAG